VHQFRPKPEYNTLLSLSWYVWLGLIRNRFACRYHIRAEAHKEVVTFFSNQCQLAWDAKRKPKIKRNGESFNDGQLKKELQQIECFKFMIRDI